MNEALTHRIGRVLSADKDRMLAQHANKNRLLSPEELYLECLVRALDSLKHGDTRLAVREIEYVVEKLEKVA